MNLLNIPLKQCRTKHVSVNHFFFQHILNKNKNIIMYWNYWRIWKSLSIKFVSIFIGSSGVSLLVSWSIQPNTTQTLLPQNSFDKKRNSIFIWISSNILCNVSKQYLKYLSFNIVLNFKLFFKIYYDLNFRWIFLLNRSQLLKYS